MDLVLRARHIAVGGHLGICAQPGESSSLVGLRRDDAIARVLPSMAEGLSIG